MEAMATSIQAIFADTPGLTTDLFQKQVEAIFVLCGAKSFCGMDFAMGYMVKLSSVNQATTTNIY
eukprot:2086625-Amphidinium_carterae.1